MREILGTLAGYALLAPFAHIVAAIALAPLLYFARPEHRRVRNVPAGLALCIVWWAMCLGAIEFAQFAQAPATIGLFIGAMMNVAIVFAMQLKNGNYSLGTAAAWVAVYIMPALGFCVGSLLE